MVLDRELVLTHRMFRRRENQSRLPADHAEGILEAIDEWLREVELETERNDEQESRLRGRKITAGVAYSNAIAGGRQVFQDHPLSPCEKAQPRAISISGSAASAHCQLCPWTKLARSCLSSHRASYKRLLRSTFASFPAAGSIGAQGISNRLATYTGYTPVGHCYRRCAAARAGRAECLWGCLPSLAAKSAGRRACADVCAFRRRYKLTDYPNHRSRRADRRMSAQRA